MKKLLTLLALCCLVVTGAWAQAPAETQAAAAEEVIRDFMGENPGLTVNVTINPSLRGSDGKDQFTYQLSGTTLTITASNGVSACRGFYDFVKSNGAGICSWSANRFKALDTYTVQNKTVTSPYRDHQYLNVVTYGYSMPYWDENRWDKEIAWMALHGIDMPLMLVGSEAIYRDVFKALYNTTDEELNAWEVGPAHLPWMRMGNLAGNSFDGPLGENWHTKQKALAKHILERMGKLGMKPVVPAFGGFVPPAVAEKLGAGATGWNWVPADYKNHRLTPTAGVNGQDGDFKKIGKKFIELWDAEYQSSYGSEFKYYLSDSFNEMDVPSDPTTLQTYGEQIYGAIKEGSGNNDAVWVTQGWEFVYGSGKWTNGSTSDAKYKALTAGVPQGKFMSLYMSPEYGNGKWSSYDNFDGDDWVYTMLPNMGGKNFWTGPLQNYATTWPQSMANSGAASNCTGWGMTPEGIEYNELLYELIADMGWTDPSTGKNLNNWVLEYGNARYGSDKYSDKFKALHTTLRNTVYTNYQDHLCFGWQGYTKDTGYYTSGNISKTNDTFFEGFEAFFGSDNIAELKAIVTNNGGLDETMRADLIEFAAFYAAARIDNISKRITTAKNTGSVALAHELMDQQEKIMTDMDYILTGHPIYDEAKWEAKAYNFGDTEATKKKYVKNARRIVSNWYGNHQGKEAVNDYACRIYAGLIRDYYLPRLKADLQNYVDGTSYNLRDIERTFCPNGIVSDDVPALSTPGYYFGSDTKTLVEGGMTKENTPDDALIDKLQQLVEEAHEAGQVIIEKNEVQYSTNASSHWYFINSNDPSYTKKALTLESLKPGVGNVSAQDLYGTNNQIWRFVQDGGIIRMENREGLSFTWENAAKGYQATINPGITLELDEDNLRYALKPAGMADGKAINLSNANGILSAANYQNGSDFIAGSTWTLSSADSYVSAVPSEEDFARITRSISGFNADEFGDASLYGSDKPGQPKSAADLATAISTLENRDLALETYTQYLAKYDEVLNTYFNVPTDPQAKCLFNLILSAFQLSRDINTDTETETAYRNAILAAQNALANGATGSQAQQQITTLEAAFKEYISIDDINATINYTPLTTNCWTEWGSRAVPSAITNINAQCTKDNLRVIERRYKFTNENNKLQATFQYDKGSHRTDIIGVEVLNENGIVIGHDYHYAFSGSGRQKCLYTVENIPAGTYTVRYIATKKYGNEGNADTNGTIKNVVTEMPAEGTWTASNWTACSTAQTTNFKSAAYYDAKQITVGSAASTRRQVRAKAAEQGTNTVAVTVKFTGGTHAQALYGVQLLNEDGTVAAETAYELYSLGTNATTTYTLNNVADGIYTVRVWSAATKGNETMTATGTVEVAVNGTKDGETLNWDNTSWNIENTDMPSGMPETPSVGITLNQGNGQTRTYYYMDKQMTFNKATTLTTTITNNDNTTDLDLIGVELLKSGTLVTTAGSYDGHYSDGETDNTYTVQVPEAGDYTVRTWASYVPANVPASGGAEYVAEIPVDEIGTINYTNLTDNTCWTEWGDRTIPEDITNINATCNADNLRVIEKRYKFTDDYSKLVATFQYSTGSHGTSIVGVEVLNDEGEVVASEYRYGFTGGSKEKIAYTLAPIPAGTYNVRYITTKLYGTETNTLTNGTITNVVTPITYTFDSKNTYTLRDLGGNRGYIAYNPNSTTNVGLADVTLSGYASKHPLSTDEGVGINWTITEDANNRVTFYCQKNGKYIAANGDKAVWSDTPAYFTYTKNQNGTVCFQLEGTSKYLKPACGQTIENGPVRFETNKENCCDFTITEIVVPVEPLTTTLSPEAETTVKSSDLATITVTFTGDGAEKVCFDEEWPAVLADEEMESYVAGITTKVSDGVFEIAFDTAEITEGQWMLNVSDGFFYIPGEPNTELPGFLATYTVEASEVILQDRHLYTIKGEFSDGSFAPVVCENNVIKGGANGATPETFVFFETTYTNKAGLTPLFKLGTAEGNGYFTYGANGAANATTKANAATVAFPTSETALTGGVTFEGGGFMPGYFGMVGLGGENIYRSYVIKPNTDINYNTRDNKSQISASNQLGATSAWCMNYVIEEVKGYTVYDIKVDNANATVSYNGESGNTLTTVAQGDGGYIVLKDGVTPSESNLNITGIPAGYTATVSFSDHTITITATADSPEAVIQTPIDYNPLNSTASVTSVWSTLEASKLPDGIKALDPTNFTTDNIRVIEKQYTFTRELSNLQSTFQYTTGSHRTDIVGVDIVNGDGDVVYSDYHFGWTGSNGSKLDNVYTIENILPGQYTVRYFSTAKSAGQNNTATNGTITNTLPPSAIYTVHLSETTKVTSGTPQVYRKGQVYGEGDSFTAISGSVTPDQISSAHDYLGVDVVIAADGENFNVNATYTTLYHPTWRTDGFEGKEGTTHALKTDGTTKYMIFDTATQGTEDWAGFMYPNGNKVGKTNPCTPLEFKGPEMYLWTVEDAHVETGDGFYLKNVATGKYYDGYGNPHADKETAAIIYIQDFPEATMAKADSTAHSVNRYEEPIVDINDDKGCWAIGASREAMTTVGDGPCWNGGKAAFNAWWCSSPFAFYEVVTLEKDLQNTEDIKDVLIDYCEYFEGMNDDSHDYRTYQEMVDDARNLSLNGSFTEYVNILREEKDMKVSYPQPVEIEGKKYGRFITVRNAVNLDYLKGSAVSMDRAVMWLNADNELVSFDTGLGYSGTTAATPVAGAKAFDVLTLSDVSPKRGTLVVKTSDNKYLASSGDREHGTSFTSQTEATATNATTWYVDNADYVDVNIPASGYTTFYAPVPMAVNYTDGTADADIYCVKANEGSDETGLHVCTLELSKMVNFIPAGQAVILKGNPGAVRINVLYDGYTLGEEGSCGTNEETYFYDEMTPSIIESYNSLNVLKAYDYTYVNSQTAASGGVDGKYIYTLSNGTFQYYTGSTIKAFKCFLELTQDYRAGYNRDAAANPFRIIFNDDATGISGTKTSSGSNAFDLSGRRINVQSQRGLYIQNGKKVVR